MKIANDHWWCCCCRYSVLLTRAHISFVVFRLSLCSIHRSIVPLERCYPTPIHLRTHHLFAPRPRPYTCTHNLTLCIHRSPIQLISFQTMFRNLYGLDFMDGCEIAAMPANGWRRSTTDEFIIRSYLKLFLASVFFSTCSLFAFAFSLFSQCFTSSFDLWSFSNRFVCPHRSFVRSISVICVLSI